MNSTALPDLQKTMDWNQLWKEAKSRTDFKWDRRAFWNQRAPEFAAHAAAGTYAEKFIRLLQPRPGWSILDIGCGAGTLALPLASRVAAITALDISDRMLEILTQRCQEANIRTIRTIQASWDDDWDALGIGTHDVVIASRSFYSDDLALAIAKVNRLARERVVFSALVHDGPYDRRQYTAIGRKLDRGPDYIYTLNYLHQIGIYARLQFIEEIEDKTYPNLTAALDGQRWMFGSLQPEEEARLKTHLASRLVPRENGWVFPKPKITRWAYLEWDPREGEEQP
jgi:SAM-dependent methyltransferase